MIVNHFFVDGAGHICLAWGVCQPKEVAALKAKEAEEAAARDAERARRAAEEAERMKDPEYRARKKREEEEREAKRQQAIKDRRSRATTTGGSRIKDLQSRLQLDVGKLNPAGGGPKPGQARALASGSGGKKKEEDRYVPSAAAAAGLAAIMNGGKAPGGPNRVSKAQEEALKAQQSGTTERLTTPARARPSRPGGAGRGRKRPSRRSRARTSAVDTNAIADALAADE